MGQRLRLEAVSGQQDLYFIISPMIDIHRHLEAAPQQAENVRFSIERLGAARIGLGVAIAIAMDKDVVALVKNTGVPLETCPKSNLLGATADAMSGGMGASHA